MIVVPEQYPNRLFLLEMLLEAAYPPGSRPTFVEAEADPRVQQWLQDFGHRLGDLAVVAYEESLPVGAAWCRLFDQVKPMGVVGIIGKGIPCLGIAVKEEFRSGRVGKRLLEALCERSGEAGFAALSLAVGRSNPAGRLYQRIGFVIVSEEPVLVMEKVL